MTKKLLLLSIAILAGVILTMILRNDPMAIAPIAFGIFVAGVLAVRIVALSKMIQTYQKAISKIEEIADEPEEDQTPRRLSVEMLALQRIKVQCRIIDSWENLGRPRL